MRKNKINGVIFFIVLALSVAGAILWGSSNLRGVETEKEQFKSGYDFMTKALRQFPYPYKLVGDQRLGTLVGSSMCDDDSGRCINLRIVTRDDELATIRVVAADEINLALFLHDLSSSTGKYKFWHPVILFPEFAEKPEPKDVYGIRELDIVGRFIIHFDVWGPDPNKILGFENEMYYR